MTRRWVLGKEPTKADVKEAISNATVRMLNPNEVEAIAIAIMRLYKDRAEKRR